MKVLPPKTLHVIQYICEQVSLHHNIPSMREIMRGCEISSTSQVTMHLDRLESARYIKRKPDKARGIIINWSKVSELEITRKVDLKEILSGIEGARALDVVFADKGTAQSFAKDNGTNIVTRTPDHIVTIE